MRDLSLENTRPSSPASRPSRAPTGRTCCCAGSWLQRHSGRPNEDGAVPYTVEPGVSYGTLTRAQLEQRTIEDRLVRSRVVHYPRGVTRVRPESSRTFEPTNGLLSGLFHAPGDTEADVNPVVESTRCPMLMMSNQISLKSFGSLGKQGEP